MNYLPAITTKNQGGKLMDYKIELKNTASQPVLSIRSRTTVGELPQYLGYAFQAVIEYLNEIGEQPIDAPFAAYYNIDMENLDVEAGFPVSNKLSGRGEIKLSEIPPGKQASCLYKGSYTEMKEAYEAMHDWVEKNAYLPTGVVYEFYYNSPTEVPEQELLTKIVFLIK
jgi:effector-binding domain-containing protein